MPKLRLSYANVTSTLALVLALAGGTAFAATHLAKNSVGTRQIKKNAVTTAKVADAAITGDKIKAGTIDGSKIDLARLGTVPSATTATTAVSAGTASNLAAPEPWHEVGAPGQPAFENGFHTVLLAPGFYRDRQCVVHLSGELEGISGKTAFTLPPGFRPSKDALSAVAVGGPLAGNVEILTSGEVKPFGQGGGTHNYGLDSVTFRVAGC
ncbi:MAG: hypothetical protein U0R71_02410 [Solirubrobacterales bacterium]